MRCGAVIPAAGSSTRFGPGDKTMLQLGGRPLLAWVLDALFQSDVIDEIVIAVSEINEFSVQDLIAGSEPPIPVNLVTGGATRMQSVQAGVRALTDSPELVLIHDAARPLVSPDIVNRTIQSASEHGAAIPGVPVTDTIKQFEAGVVRKTVDRETLVAVQTPQVFRRDWLLAAYDAETDLEKATDEASILEIAGHSVYVVAGDPTNIKVTTPTDVLIANAFLAAREVDA